MKELPEQSQSAGWVCPTPSPQYLDLLRRCPVGMVLGDWLRANKRNEEGAS